MKSYKCPECFAVSTGKEWNTKTGERCSITLIDDGKTHWYICPHCNEQTWKYDPETGEQNLFEAQVLHLDEELFTL